MHACPLNYSGLHTGFFMGGTHISTLVWPLGGLVACSPRKFFVFYVMDSDLILGGTSWRGEIPVCPPPPCPPLCVTLLLHITSIINPRRTCAGEGYCTWSVCVCACVCPSVCLSAHSCPPFFSTTAAALSFKRGYVLR